MRIYPFQAEYPNMDFVTSNDAFFGSIRDEFVDYCKSGFFQKLAEPAVFVVEIENTRRKYTGIIACTDIRDFEEGHIKKHEGTLASKEQQQMHVLIRFGAQTKPVMMAYPSRPEIDRFMDAVKRSKEPFLEIPFESTGECHRFWRVDDPERIGRLRTFFAEQIQTTYIADGHHRTTTMALIHERLTGKPPYEGEYDKLLGAFFPMGELEILEFNRVVKGRNENSLPKLIVRISQVCEIEILDVPSPPRQKFEFLMYLEGDWYRLRWKDAVLRQQRDRIALLDAHLLNAHILRDILGVTDVRDDTRMRYVAGPLGLEGVRQETMKTSESIGFCLYPVSQEDFKALADANQMLPPKSTWFEPRLKSGVLVKKF